MRVIRKASLLRGLGTLSLVFAMTACNAAGGSLEGSANQKNLKNKETGPASGPKDNTSYDSSGKPLDSNSTRLPGTQPPSPASSDESVDVPSTITGTLLFCFKDKIEGAKATVLCAVEDSGSKKPIALASKYVSHKWSFAAPSALTVAVKELPLTGLWQAEYTITGSSPEIVTAGLSSVTFAFEGSDINAKKDSLDIKVTNQVRPDLTIRSLKPQTAAEFRCFDYFRLKGDKIVTTPCGAQNSAQDWFITADNKIAHVSGVCIEFNPVSSLTIEGDCKLGETPRFEFSGEQIKIRDTNSCIGLINPDASGVDYVAVVSCNTADITQHWKISPTILP